jgi:hypothetical protein
MRQQRSSFANPNTASKTSSFKIDFDIALTPHG